MEKVTLSRVSPFKKKMQERNKNLLADYKKYSADPEQSKLQLMNYLRDKYGFQSIQSVYKVLRREGV